eukprot:TRINITY_DN35734_c0_g1_i1.p1 TRINITY_DN35734_c0_g1~~TRINITY_DN35734_c0_g1_i1.p1  ORF type:complete len:229 (-),score=22.16 TRINITY_DN35734_c0_g1_i1:340-1026(-)
MLHLLPQLGQCRIVLASASPRRREILQMLGLNVEVVPSTFEENLDKQTFPTAGDYAQETATRKAMEVATRISAQRASDGARPLPHLVIAADTIVELSGRIFEKPLDKQDAFNTLRTLSGKKHRVFTGVALVKPSTKDQVGDSLEVLRNFYDKTEVEFGCLSEEDILAYVGTHEPMDKAGSYGVQGLGSVLVRSIEGCYYNVMGFPVHRFSVELADLVRSGRLVLPTLA